MNKSIKNENRKEIILPFRYAGGKFYALKKLKKFWEAVDHDEYREPFLGGGAVFWTKEKVKFNWLNDIDKDLMKTLRFIKSPKKRKDLVKLFKEDEADKESYELVKNMIPKSEIDEVYKFYYLNRTSFSGKMNNPSWGYRPKRSLPPYRWKERINPCGEKLNNVTLTAYDFVKVIETPAKGKKVLMFLDPPYFLPGKNTHYKNGFDKNDHERLLKTLKKTKYKFFLTYEDCPEIRKMYKWANIYPLDFYYRLDNSKDRKDKRKIGNELVITNYKINNGKN